MICCAQVGNAAGNWCPYLTNAMSHLQISHSSARDKNLNYARTMKCTWSAEINCIIRDYHYSIIVAIYSSISKSLSNKLGAVLAAYIRYHMYIYYSL
jgi:hypothetical protein